MKTDMELLSNSMATYAHIKGNYGNHSACYTVKKKKAPNMYPDCV